MSPETAIIAHRGACGYLPEHCLEAKALAYAQGADYLEQDVVATRDGVLVVLHDIYLDDVSDVAARYPGRTRADGRHYVIDFDWPEIRQLELNERRAGPEGERVFPGRFPAEHCGFRIARLEEELHFVRGLNRTLGLNVGIYPEIKQPAWHLENGFDLALDILNCLRKFGYASENKKIFLQCFDSGELRRLHGPLGCEIPLIQLLDREETARADWPAIASYAAGVGLPYDTLLCPADTGGRPSFSGLGENIRSAGLQMHPYTFRRDRPEAGFGTFGDLIALFSEALRVEALFCDHPDAAVAARNGNSNVAWTAPPG